MNRPVTPIRSVLPLKGTLFTCPECEQELPFGLFCSRCSISFPERNQHSPFALLGLEERFEQDPEVLDQAIDEARSNLMAATRSERGSNPEHPARWARGELDRIAALLNRPWTRAEWLLHNGLSKAGCTTPTIVTTIKQNDDLHEIKRELNGRPGLDRRRALHEYLSKMRIEIESDLTEDLDLLDDVNDPPETEIVNAIGVRIERLRVVYELLAVAMRRWKP